jgi:hypothetical protein
LARLVLQRASVGAPISPTFRRPFEIAHRRGRARCAALRLGGIEFGGDLFPAIALVAPRFVLETRPFNEGEVLDARGV